MENSVFHDFMNKFFDEANIKKFYENSEVEDFGTDLGAITLNESIYPDFDAPEFWNKFSSIFPDECNKWKDKVVNSPDYNQELLFGQYYKAFRKYHFEKVLGLKDVSSSMPFVGSLDTFVNNAFVENIYRDIEGKYVNEYGNEYGALFLHNFALILNSPWSLSDTKDILFWDYVGEEPVCYCYKQVVGYEGMNATLRGIGLSKTEAIANCDDMFEEIETIYNVDNESF